MIWHSSMNWSDRKQFFNLLSPQPQQLRSLKFRVSENKSSRMRDASRLSAGVRNEMTIASSWRWNCFIMKKLSPQSPAKERSVSTYHNLCVSWLRTFNNLIFHYAKRAGAEARRREKNNFWILMWRNNNSFNIFDAEPSSSFPGCSLGGKEILPSRADRVKPREVFNRMLSSINDTVKPLEGHDRLSCTAYTVKPCEIINWLQSTADTVRPRYDNWIFSR